MQTTVERSERGLEQDSPPLQKRKCHTFEMPRVPSCWNNSSKIWPMLQREHAWYKSNNLAPVGSPELDGNKVEEMPLDRHARPRSGHKNQQKPCYAINVIRATVQARSGLGWLRRLESAPFLFNSGRNPGVGTGYHQPTSNPKLTSKKKKNQPKKNLCYQIPTKNNLVFREINLKQVLWTLCTQVSKQTNSRWVQGAWILVSHRILSKTSDLPGS